MRLGTRILGKLKWPIGLWVVSISVGALAAGPGSTTFSFFKKAALIVFRSVGAYPVPSNVWTTVNPGSPTYGTGKGMFAQPNAIATDAGGFLYVADSSNQRITKLSASTGAVVGSIGNVLTPGGTCTTTGSAAAWCSGGVFSFGSAPGMFNGPSGIATDSSGNLYIADTGNHRIVKVNAASGAIIGAIGNVSFSGGTCTTTGAASGWCSGGSFSTGTAGGMFNSPWGIATDGAGNLYIADTGNHRIVKVNASTGAFVGAIGNVSVTGGTCSTTGAASGWCSGGTFTTGTGSGAFSSPAGIALDPGGNLYVADVNNYRVVKLSAASGSFVGAIGNVSVTGGTCTATGAPAGWCSGGTFSSSAGNGAYQGPKGVAVDGSDNLYIADSGGSRIVKVTASSGAFVGAVGNIWSANGTCTPIGAASGWCSGGTFAGGVGNGMFNSPAGISIDGSGILYIADTGNSRIIQMNASSGSFIGATGAQRAATSAWSFSAGGPAGGGDGMYYVPFGAAVDGAGFLYISDRNNNRIVKLNASTGAFLGAIGYVWIAGGTCTTTGPASGWCSGGTFASGTSSGMFYGPSSIATDGSGYLYIADTNNNRIVKLNATTGAFVGAIGKISTTGGTCTTANAASGWCSGGAFASGSGDGMFNQPNGIAVDGSGMLYVSEIGNNRIVKINASSGAFVGAIGNVTASTGTCSVGVATGWCTGGTFTSGTGNGMYFAPAGIAVDNSGNLYVADQSNKRVAQINAATGAFVGAIGNVATTGGTCTTTGPASGWCAGGTFSASSGNGAFNYPSAVALDGAGNLYIADQSNNRIVKVTASTGAFVGAIGKVAVKGGTCKSLGAASGWCSGGIFTNGSGSGMFYAPSGLAIDSNGELYIVDQGNYRIVKASRH